MDKGDVIRLRKFHAKKDLWTIFNKLEDCVDGPGAEKLRKLIQDTINAIDIIITEEN